MVYGHSVTLIMLWLPVTHAVKWEFQKHNNETFFWSFYKINILFLIKQCQYHLIGRGPKIHTKINVILQIFCI